MPAPTHVTRAATRITRESSRRSHRPRPQRQRSTPTKLQSDLDVCVLLAEPAARLDCYDMATGRRAATPRPQASAQTPRRSPRCGRPRVHQDPRARVRSSRPHNKKQQHSPIPCWSAQGSRTPPSSWSVSTTSRSKPALLESTQASPVSTSLCPSRSAEPVWGKMAVDRRFKHYLAHTHNASRSLRHPQAAACGFGIRCT